MSGQSSDVPGLFEKRMQVIGQLSQENAEHLRILQLRNGHEVLLMKNPKVAEIGSDRQDAEAHLDACLQRVDALELELARIDKQIAAAAQTED